MIKLFNVIKKNFKLLLRNKSSAIVVLIGPLLIILLIGLAFNNAGSEYLLTIGVYSKSTTDATATFMAGLDEKYDVTEFYENNTCIDSVKQGITNICIIFPENMILDDETQDEIILYIDESRINLVDTVINKISSIIGISVESSSKDLTSSLLTTVTLTKTELESNLFRAVNIKQNTELLITDADSLSSEISNMDLDASSVDISGIDSDVETLYSRADSIKDDALDAIEDALDIIIEEVTEGINSTEYGIFQAYYEDINDTNINDSYVDVIDKLDDAADDLDDLEEKLDSANTQRTNIIDDVDSIKSSLSSVKADITQLKTSLESISDSISEIKVFSAESIVNPVTTTIKPIGTGAQKSTYMLPFLIILIIMFIGIMLSGTSIIIDKMSPASFRTFASPTRDSFYLIAYYITNVIILLGQIIIIGGLITLSVGLEILNNFGLTLLIIFLACSLFILIGMAFGYLFKSQEGVTIASLSFASVLLFVSNLIIPLESAPLIVQQIARYNPYVILSSILKKVMLFNVGILEIVGDLALIALYIILVFIFILIIQKLSKIIYFKKIPWVKSKKSEELIEKECLRIADGRVLKNKRDFLEFIETCGHDEFREFVDHDQNKFTKWARIVLNDKKLARKLKKLTDRDKIVKIVEENVAKGVRQKGF